MFADLDTLEREHTLGTLLAGEASLFMDIYFGLPVAEYHHNGVGLGFVADDRWGDGL